MMGITQHAVGFVGNFLSRPRVALLQCIAMVLWAATVIASKQHVCTGITMAHNSTMLPAKGETRADSIHVVVNFQQYPMVLEDAT